MALEEETNEQVSRVGSTTNERTLHLDGVLSTQPELGPSIPDGGYGWAVFASNLFFQAVIPNLIVSFGIFLAFSRLENADDHNPQLWDEKLLHVPLFYMISRTVLDPLSRALITKSTWPRLVGTSGTCLTCAGLLFMWMGMTGNDGGALFVLAGCLTGLGASLQLTQCEILLTQYFRMKLAILSQISKAFSALGFVFAPALLGHNIINTSLLHVILWYQAIILQGLVVNIIFKKPMYMKLRAKSYQFVTVNPDDEEDIFSKNSRELQIKRQTSTESHVSKIEIEPRPGTSGVGPPETWEKFDEEDEDIVKYDQLQEWETFDDEDELSKKQQQSSANVPSPLFSDLPVNNNNTYAYDDEIRVESRNSNVFAPTVHEKRNWLQNLNVLAEPTFYKSLLMVVTTNFSIFVFFSMFPSYLYEEVKKIQLRQMSTLMGTLSLATLIFTCVSYWVRVEKKRRPICLWILCWMGSVGYFMISDFNNQYVLLIGATLIVVSIAALDHVQKSLLGITIKGEVGREYGLLCILGGLSLLFFLIADMSFKSCFHILAVLHFFTGALWLANFIYKKLR